MEQKIKELSNQISDTLTNVKTAIISYMEEHNLTSVDFTTDFKGIPMFNTEYEGVVDEDEYYNNRVFILANDGKYCTWSASVSTIKLVTEGDIKHISIEAEDEYATFDDSDIYVSASDYLEILRWMVTRFGE